MEITFGPVLAGLRRGSGLNQRQLALELGISQALLSHYENGTREPGLPFICRVCDYFGVSADFVLGRTDIPEGGIRRSPGERELERLLEADEDTNIRKACRSCVDAQSRRLAALIQGDLTGAVVSLSKVSQAELELLDAVKNKK